MCLRQPCLRQVRCQTQSGTIFCILDCGNYVVNFDWNKFEYRAEIDGHFDNIGTSFWSPLLTPQKDLFAMILKGMVGVWDLYWSTDKDYVHGNRTHQNCDHCSCTSQERIKSIDWMMSEYNCFLKFDNKKFEVFGDTGRKFIGKLWVYSQNQFCENRKNLIKKRGERLFWSNHREGGFWSIFSQLYQITMRPPDNNDLIKESHQYFDSLNDWNHFWIPRPASNPHSAKSEEKKSLLWELWIQWACMLNWFVKLKFWRSSQFLKVQHTDFLNIERFWKFWELTANATSHQPPENRHIKRKKYRVQHALMGSATF